MTTENKSFTPNLIRDLWQTPKAIFDYYYNRFEFAYDLAASEHNALTGLFCSEDDSAFASRQINAKSKPKSSPSGISTG